MALATPSYAEFIADTDRSCAIVAHRGDWHAAPENSLLAIERAIAGGSDAVEIDIRRSADGEFFLLHDDTLERMAGVDRRPEDLTSDELARLNLRNRNGGSDNEFTAEKLPSLKDVFSHTRDRIFLHLDIKRREQLPKVIACAREMGVERQVDYWGDLRTPEDLNWVREMIEPHGVLFMAKTRLNAPDVKTQLDVLFKLGPRLCEVYFDNLEQVSSLHERCSERGIKLWYNTLDDVSCAGFNDTAALSAPEAIWGCLIDAGISVIQTDYPDRLKSFISKRDHARATA